ncbi:MAG TPA: hypothetical protein EYQ07_05895 [Candidatus Poseidoniales archaeon]|nr:MAG: hypothetical protein CXT64_05195 [Euryarchaeota archaeon]HIE82038.1 hypothetical protein [Candidatus Poseidoniales archaeon]
MACSMADSKALLRHLTSRRARRGALVFAFWAMLLMLVSTIGATYIIPGQTQQSAYGDDWDDLGSFRAEVASMGVETTALVSSPLLLSEIDNPEQAIFVISGVERDTISLPRFTGDENIIDLKESDGYTSSEIAAIKDFVKAGGTILLMDDFGYSAGLALEYGLEYSGHHLYDGEAWARQLGYQYVWANETSAFNFTSTSGSVANSIHPCLRDVDMDGIIDLLDDAPYDPNVGGIITVENVGLCAHRWDETTGEWDFSESYNLLTNSPSAFEKTSSFNPAENRYAIVTSTLDSYLDTNDDGNLTIGFEAAGIEGDEQGPFAIYVRYCVDRMCLDSDSGRVHFVSDGSILINSLYDAGPLSPYSRAVPENDNRKWVLDLVAEALLLGNSSTSTTDDAIVIFDESRHQQTTPMGDTYNLLYYLLVYFTNDWMAMLMLFLALFIILEAVLIRKDDPDDWRHVFRIIYYGFGDARRYEYYQRPSKIRQVLLTRVRNLNTMSREEFDAMPAAELQRVVDDPVLVQFIFEDRRYKPDELVGIIKRIKAWGQTSEESDS